jgi:hypothetical protein
VTGIAALHWSRSQAPVNRKSLLTGRSYELRAKAAYRIYADVSFGPVATDLINQKRAGNPITPKELPAANNVVDLMEVLRRSVGNEAAPAKGGKKPPKAASDALDQMAPRRPVAVHHDRMRAPVITAVDQHARGRRMTTFRRVREDRAYKQDWLEFRV